jgi:hypothetical protein
VRARTQPDAIARRCALVLSVAALALSAGADPAGAADGPPRQSRITTFTISPAESLPARPRSSVETKTLAPPAPPVPIVTPAVALAPDQLLGRWTEQDPAYCREERYLLDWQPDRVRVVLDGRAIDSGAVRYVADGPSLKIERLTDAGEVAGYWRFVAVDAATIAWVETAEKRGDAFEVVAQPDKVFLRCATGAEPAPGFVTRLRRWWNAKLERWWPSAPADKSDPPPTS